MVLMTVAQTLRNVGLIPYRLSPLVFGIGLSKTGTTSLGVALQQLGFRHKSYDAELLEKWHFGKVDEVLAGMEAYSSFEDFPLSTDVRRTNAAIRSLGALRAHR